MFLRHKETLLVVAWSMFVGLVWMAPALFGKAMHIGDHDTALYYYPIFDFYAKALQSGQSFLWIPGMFSGFPVYVSQTGGFFDPINLLIFSFLSGIDGVHLRLWLDIVATCVFSYLAARSFKVPPVVAALVGPSYLVAFHLRFLSNPVIANTLFLVPLLLFAVNELCFRDRVVSSRILLVALMGGGIGIALLGGYTQIVLYALIATGLYLLLRTLLHSRNNTRLFVRGMGYMALGTVIGVVIGLPFIIPAARFLPFTPRTEAPTYAQATLKSVHPTDTVLFALPDHIYIPYITSGRMPLYVGSFFFLCAAAVMAYAGYVLLRRFRLRSDSDSELAALSAVAVTFFALSIKHSPLYYLLAQLPLIGLFRFPYRFMYVGAFYLAILGALGFSRMDSLSQIRVVRIAMWALIAVYAVLAASIAFLSVLTDTMSQWIVGRLHDLAVFLNIYGLLGLPKSAEHYEARALEALNTAREFLDITQWDIAVPVLVLIGTITIGSLYLRRGANATWYYAGVILTAGTVLSIPLLRYKHFVPVANAGTAAHAVIDHLEEGDERRYRMYSFLLSEGAAQGIPPQFKLSEGEERALLTYNVRGGLPNYFLYHGIGSVDGYDPFESTNTLHAMGLVGGEYEAGYGKSGPHERVERLLANLDVLAMMGGKYLVSGVELHHPDLRAIAVEHVSHLALPLYVYTLDARPRYYFAEHVTEYPHEDFRSLLGEDRASFADTTYVDCVGCGSVTGVGDISVLRQDPGVYEFETRTDHEEVLVLSESFLPGWRVTIDRVSSEPVRVNGLYFGVRVPEGVHVVRFEYQGLLNELSVLKALNIVR